MNDSIAVAPIEFISIIPYNPLISKCQIKVCWVGDEPNPNKSIISRETAIELANSIPGNPIVGKFNEDTGDFEQHNKIIEIKDGKFRLKEDTFPYGFVDLNAKVWFQKFDDNGIIHEYLVTEGWLWTGQYPECQRVINKGNNQSMELDKDTINAHWTKDNNGNKEFFIINEAIMSKLCILGENYKPCFEGANITAPKIEFSLGENFEQQMLFIMNEIKTILSEGGKTVFTQYALEIGDGLYRTIRAYLSEKYPNTNEECDWRTSDYYIHSIYEEGSQKFAILVGEDSNKLYRMNFVYTKDSFTAEELIEVEATYIPKENKFFSLDETKEFELKEKEKETCPECGKPLDECTCNKEDDDKKKENDSYGCKSSKDDEDKDKKTKYDLNEIPEYMEILSKYSDLETQVGELNATIETLKAENESLTKFKSNIEKAEKEEMIKKFYMLSDDDKKDVVDNIDTYSLDDIEAKLSVICVRNKVSFNLEDDNKNDDPTVYNLNSDNYSNDSAPDWVKALQEVAKNS